MTCKRQDCTNCQCDKNDAEINKNTTSEFFTKYCEEHPEAEECKIFDE